MRQIVAGLTGDSDGTGDLAVELSKTDPASLETGQDSEDDSGEPEDWVPDPVDADPGLRCQPHRVLLWRVQPVGALVSQWSPHVPWGVRGSGVRGQRPTLAVPRVLQGGLSCAVSLRACRRAACAPRRTRHPAPGPVGSAGGTGAASVPMRCQRLFPVLCRPVQLQAALLGHHQPAGQHLRQQGPVHQRVPLAAG